MSITLSHSNVTFYNNGTAISGPCIVGYYNSSNVVMRIQFTTDSTGASSITFSLDGWTNSSGSMYNTAWYITDKDHPTSYANARANNGYTNYGKVGVTSKDSAYTLGVTSYSVALLPETTYYLWLFPYDTTVSAAYANYYVRKTETWTMTTVPGNSPVSATDTGIGGTSQITITRYNSSFTHKLTYIMYDDWDTSDKTQYDITNGYVSDTSISWKITNATQIQKLYERMGTTGNSVKCIVYCYTSKDSSTYFGWSQCYVTLTASQSTGGITLSCTPTISNAPSGYSDTYVNNYSTYKPTIKATTKYGATVSSVVVTNGSTKKTYTSVTSGTAFTTAVFPAASSPDITVTATDSRGLSTTYSYKASKVVSYWKPTIDASASSMSNTTNNISAVASGKVFVGSIFGKDNAYSISYAIKDTTSGNNVVSGTLTSSDSGIVPSSTSYKVTKSISSDDLDYTHYYSITMTITDLISSVSTSYVISCTPIFYWNQNNVYFNQPVHLVGGISGSTSCGSLTSSGKITGENIQANTSSGWMYGAKFVYTDGTYRDDSTVESNKVGYLGRKDSVSETSVTMTSATGTNIASITLPAGSWILFGNAKFPAQNYGIRRLSISNSSGSIKDYACSSAYSAGASVDVYLNVSVPWVLTSETTLYLVGYQNSGSDMTFAYSNAYIYAMRIS